MKPIAAITITVIQSSTRIDQFPGIDESTRKQRVNHKTDQPEQHRAANLFRAQSTGEAAQFDLEREDERSKRAAATGVNRWPCPISTPSTKSTISETDVVFPGFCRWSNARPLTRAIRSAIAPRAARETGQDR